MNNAPIINVSHLANLPKGEDEAIKVTRESALEEVMTVVIDEVKKHGFDYCDVIMAVSHYAFKQRMTTVELFLEAAYAEAYDFNEQRQTRQAIQETFAKIREMSA